MAVQKIVNLEALSRMRGMLEASDGMMDLYSSINKKYSFIEEENLLATTIVLPEESPSLLVSGKIIENDAENAIKVYEYLGKLTRTQATDMRLWVTLTHTTFWDYCKQRWPVEGRAPSYIIDHWFDRKGGGLSALRRNAISRLWWAANLTMAPWEDDAELALFKSSDRAKYTRILLSQQQNFQDVLERSYGGSLRLRICLLDSLGIYQPKLSNKDDLIKKVSIEINLLVKHRQLDAMDISELRGVLDGLVKNAAEQVCNA